MLTPLMIVGGKPKNESPLMWENQARIERELIKAAGSQTVDMTVHWDVCTWHTHLEVVRVLSIVDAFEEVMGPLRRELWIWTRHVDSIKNKNRS